MRAGWSSGFEHCLPVRTPSFFFVLTQSLHVSNLSDVPAAQLLLFSSIVRPLADIYLRYCLRFPSAISSFVKGDASLVTW